MPSTPLIVKLYRPDGVEDRRETLPDQGNGGRSWQIALPDTAMTGSWRLAAYVDPKAPALYEKTFLVEDYVPERLEMKLTASQPVIAAGTPGVVAARGPISLWRAGFKPRPRRRNRRFPPRTRSRGFPGYRVGLEERKVHHRPQGSRSAAEYRCDGRGFAFHCAARAAADIEAAVRPM